MIVLFNFLWLEKREQLKEIKYSNKQERGQVLSALFTGFLYDLAPWENDDMPFRRFLAVSGDILKDKHPDICETFCRGLMDAMSVSDSLNKPKAKELMTDLVAQPHLLSPEAFSKGILDDTAFPILKQLILSIMGGKKSLKTD